jgi:2',3'-cyclic-nucleotide 2'-phosphodiesterase (5'-nucleotidase family)
MRGFERFVWVLVLVTLAACGRFGYAPVSSQKQQYAIDTSYQQGNAELQTILSPYRDSLESQVNAVLIRSDVAMAKAQPESALGNMLADIMLIEVGRKYEAVDVALLNYGGIRASLPKGEVTMGDVMEILPFMNYVVILELDGRLMQQLLDHWAAKGGTPISGARFSRVENKAIAVTIGGRPIDMHRTYKLATIDYLAEGGDGCGFLKTAKVRLVTPELVRDLYITAFQGMHQQGISLKAVLDDRIR